MSTIQILRFKGKELKIIRTPGPHYVLIRYEWPVK